MRPRRFARRNAEPRRSMNTPDSLMARAGARVGLLDENLAWTQSRRTKRLSISADVTAENQATEGEPMGTIRVRHRGLAGTDTPLEVAVANAAAMRAEFEAQMKAARDIMKKRRAVLRELAK